jgi:hypothetical protein
MDYYNTYTSSSGSGTATVPTATSTAASQVSAGPTGAGPAAFVGAQNVQMPSWLSTNPNDSLGELINQYSGVNAAYDPSGQVAARNAQIGGVLSTGKQAATNAATEYSNRAAQSGQSGAAAGVVKAQSMLPALMAAGSLKTEGADIAAKAKQDASTAATGIASSISGMRIDYLKMLAGYASGQQDMANKQNQFNADLALRNYSAQQNVASTAAGQELEYQKLAASTQQSQNDIALRAAQAALTAKNSGGAWTTNAQGQVVSGMDSYNRMKNFQSSQDAAMSALRGMYA